MNNKYSKIEYFIPKNINDKKVVLFVICPQKGNSLGGSDAHVLDLSEYLLNNNDYIPLVLFPHNEKYRDRLKENNIPYIFAKGCKTKLEIVREIKDLPAKINVACIHSHQYDANYLTQELIMFGGKCWKKIPVVMTCHGWVENSLKLRIMTYFDFKSYRYSDALIAVSQKDKKRLLSKVPAKSVYYIPNGVRERKYYSKSLKEEIKSKYGINDDDVIVSYIGRLSPEKRIDLVIEAANLVCQTKNNVKFLIAGNGDDISIMNQLINKYNLGKKVIYAGFVKDIDSIQSITDIILITSDTEGTPRALIESMQYGAIPVCTDVGGIRDILDNDVGFLCEPGNIKSISSGIISALQLKNNEKEKLKKRIIELSKNKFSINTMAKRVLEVYKKVEGK